MENFIRGLKTKGARIADMQPGDSMAFLFQPSGFLKGWPPDLVADLAEFFALSDYWHWLLYVVQESAERSPGRARVIGAAMPSVARVASTRQKPCPASFKGHY